jgi:hypothetical protein
VQNVDLSINYKGESYSFSGSASQKSGLSAFHIYKSPQIDFIPVEVFSDFPNINGFYLYRSNLPSTIRSDFFTKDFYRIEYLGIQDCTFQAIDESAFQYMIYLKWVRLQGNQIQSLPFLIFKSNPNLIYIDLNSNRINSINPELPKNLNQLKYVEAGGNQCINENLGCPTCSLSQSDLGSGFSTCFSNCLANEDYCAIKSGHIDNDKLRLSNNIEDQSLSTFSPSHSHKHGQTYLLLKHILQEIHHLERDYKTLRELLRLSDEVNEARYKEIESRLDSFSANFNRSIAQFEEEIRKIIADFQGSLNQTFIQNIINIFSANLTRLENRIEKIAVKCQKAIQELEDQIEDLRQMLQIKAAKQDLKIERLKYEFELTHNEIAQWNATFQLEEQKINNTGLALKLEIQQLRSEYDTKWTTNAAELRRQYKIFVQEQIDAKCNRKCDHCDDCEGSE